NPPRQPLIGHILRNIENKTEIEQLNTIVDVLTYKDTEADEIGESEESEYQKLQIDALVNPEFLNTLMKLIPHYQNQPITDYMPLDTGLSTDNALDISEKYRNIIKTIKGNAFRWETQIELIKKDIDKKLINLTVNLKDVKSRYSSKINKTSLMIDNAQIKEMMTLESDKIENWKLNRSKTVIENISLLFKNVERQLEDIIKKNRFFSRSDTIKTKLFEDISLSFEKHFTFLRQSGKKFLELIESLNQKYGEFKTQIIKINNEAEIQLKKYETELNAKLSERNKQLSEFEIEKQENISIIDDFKKKIENLFSEIVKIIQIKKENCLQEAEELMSWSLNDDRTKYFSIPIQWIYMPLYAMFLEDEATMEERITCVFPGYINNDSNFIYEEIDNGLKNLKNISIEKIYDDMRIRSNFEFSCEKKNLIEDPNFKKKIQSGISILKNNSIINDDIEKKIKENLNLIP
ncbi:MAG: hypothetical protein ACTSRI_03390, partial [Promethearchaeota archaeon]